MVTSGECPRSFSPPVRHCLIADYQVQNQVLGLLDIHVNPLFSKRFSTPIDLQRATVVDSVED